MKKLKLDHEQAQLVLSGHKHTTWRLFDDKDLRVDDDVLLVDKVEPGDPNTWRAIGVATIDSIAERRLADLTDEEIVEEGGYVSKSDMLRRYRDYYGPNVTGQTLVKAMTFHFRPLAMADKSIDLLQQSPRVVIYADGGSRGNPGPSAAGFIIYDEQHTMLVNRGIYLGVTTNNQAEYTALKLALEEALSLGAQHAHVYMDSMLVVNQMRGIFKVKNRDLWPIHETVRALCARYERVDFTQVPRESNRLADAAVNAALDEHLRTIAEPAERSLPETSKSGIIVP